MMELADIDTGLVMLIGAATALAMAVKALAERVGVPPLVGYVLLGFAASLTHARVGALDADAFRAFELLANLGIVALVFRVGISSQPWRLMKKLPDASLIWLGNVLVSGGLGYAAARHLIGLDLIPRWSRPLR